MKQTIQHTPGPWELVCGDENNIFDYVRIADRRLIICEGRSKDEANANARLIAAAPELLEALQSLCSAFDGDTECTEILDMLSKGGPIRAAIAKATQA
jgi:hypothetical protein